MLNNFIVKVFRLYKMFKFTNKGDLIINCNGSQIVMTVEGDIVVSSKRYTVHNRRLFFDGCDPEFVEETTAKYEQGEDVAKIHMECHNTALEFESYKETVTSDNGN